MLPLGTRECFVFTSLYTKNSELSGSSLPVLLQNLCNELPDTGMMLRNRERKGNINKTNKIINNLIEK